MKIQFNTKTYGSSLDNQLGLDLFESAGSSVTDAATTRGWKFMITDSLARREELTRIREFAEADPATRGNQRPPTIPGQRAQPVRRALTYDDIETDYPSFNDDVRIMTGEEANEQYGVEGQLKFEDGVSNLEAYVLRQRKLEENEFNYTLNKATGARWWKGFGLEMATAIVDPIGLAAGIAIPPLGAARLTSALAWQGSRVGTGAIRGTLSGTYAATAIEPAIYATARQEQADYGLVHSLVNVAFGGIAGGGLHVVGGTVARHLQNIRQRRHANALDTAVKQLLNGENVEVEPIIKHASEPDYPTPKNSLDPEAAPAKAADAEEPAPTTKGDPNQYNPLLHRQFDPAEDVDKSLALVDQEVQLNGGLLKAKMTKLIAEDAELRKMVEENTTSPNGAPWKHKFLLKIKTKHGALLIKEFDDGAGFVQLTDLIDMASPDSTILSSTLAMHGVQAKDAKLQYTGTLEEASPGDLHHVIEISDVDFDPAMSQHSTTLGPPAEILKSLKGSPWIAALSTDLPKRPSSAVDMEGGFVSESTAKVLDDIDTAYNIDNLKQTGEATGSQEGGFYEDIATGDKLYVKMAAKNPDGTIHDPNRIRSEFLAANLYRLFGVDFPVTRLVMDSNGQAVGVASKIMPGAKNITIENLKAGEGPNGPITQADIDAFAENSIIDMYLANWDVVGEGAAGNLMQLPGGRIVRIDPGGALEYRAMAKPDGSDKKPFGAVVSETSTMWHGQHASGQAFALHSQYSQPQVKVFERGLHRLFSIPQEDIDKLVDFSGISNASDIKLALYTRKISLAEDGAYQSTIENVPVQSGISHVAFTKAQALEKLKKISKHLYSGRIKFTTQERHAISDYTGSFHLDINKAMTKLAKDFGSIEEGINAAPNSFPQLANIKGLVSALEKGYAIDQDMVVWRGGTPLKAFDNVKGIELASAEDLAAAQAMIGGTLNWDRVISSSLSRETASKFHASGSINQVFLKINVPKGNKVLFAGEQDSTWSFGHGEHEVLLPPSTTFIVKGAKKGPGGKLIMEVEAHQVNELGSIQKPTMNKESAIKLARTHKEDSSSAVNDSTEPLPGEVDSEAQATLKFHDPGQDLNAVLKEVEELQEMADAEALNLQEDVANMFKETLDDINKEAVEGESLMAKLNKAAKAAVTCVKGAS